MKRMRVIVRVVIALVLAAVLFSGVSVFSVYLTYHREQSVAAELAKNYGICEFRDFSPSWVPAAVSSRFPWWQRVHLVRFWRGSGLYASFRNRIPEDVKVRDSDLEQIGQLTKLAELDLTSAQVSETGMFHLQKVRTLKSLRLGDPGSLKIVRNLPYLESVEVWFDRKSDGAIRELKVLKRLKALHAVLSFDDEDMFHLRDMATLEDLDIDGSGVTDAGLESLRGLVRLKGLNLSYSKITDAGLVHLKDLVNLEVLDISHTQVAGSGLMHLKGMSRLRLLNLEMLRIKDEDLEQLKGLTNLEELRLQNARITDAGLAHLTGMKKLERLQADRTRFTDGAVEHLRQLTNLKVLGVSRSVISEEARVVLRTALPACEIETGF